MFKKLALILTVFALMAAAGTLPVGSHYTITLFEPAVAQGTVLQAGEYRLTVTDTKVTIAGEKLKTPLELKVKVEKTFPLAQAGQAQALSEQGHTEGKIVLIVNEVKANRK